MGTSDCVCCEGWEGLTGICWEDKSNIYYNSIFVKVNMRFCINNHFNMKLTLYFKGIVHLKRKTCWKCSRSQARWICFFIWFGEIKYYITSSSMNHLQWMGAVRIRVQTDDKNITIIHTSPVHQLMTCEVKSCVFVRNKSIFKVFYI